MLRTVLIMKRRGVRIFSKQVKVKFRNVVVETTGGTLLSVEGLRGRRLVLSARYRGRDPLSRRG